MKSLIALSLTLLAGSLHANETNAELHAEIVALQKQIAILQPLAALAPYIHFDAGYENGLPGPHITFSGVNVHVNNGCGSTSITNGRGNIILGYDEIPVTSGIDTAMADAFIASSRTGSHNLVIGPGHDFGQGSFGNLIAGSQNIASGQGEVVAGHWNQVSGLYSSVLGGYYNTCSGLYSILIGGQNNQISGLASILLGGYNNQESGFYCTLLGGVGVDDGSPEFTVVQ